MANGHFIEFALFGNVGQLRDVRLRDRHVRGRTENRGVPRTVRHVETIAQTIEGLVNRVPPNWHARRLAGFDNLALLMAYHYLVTRRFAIVTPLSVLVPFTLLAEVIDYHQQLV